MNNRQKSAKNIIYGILSQIMAIAFGLLLPRIILVSYGSEVNGILNSLAQFLVYLNLFEAGVGAATLQALYRPVAQSDWGCINGILSATNRFLRRTGQFYLGALILLSVGYPLIVDSSLPYWTICGAVFFTGIGNVVTFYIREKYRILLLADGKYYIVSGLTTVVSVLMNLAKIGLILLGCDIVLVLAVAFCINCIQVVYTLWYVRRHYRDLDVNAAPDYDAIAQKNFTLIHQIDSLVFHNTDVVILTVFCDLKVVSVYSMFKLITNHLDQILNILVTAVKFMLGQAFQTDLERYKKMIDGFESVNSAISYAVYSVALYLYLPFMALYTHGVTDVNYLDEKLAVLFVATALLTHSRVPMLQTIEYAGHFQQTVSRAVAEAVINLVVSLIGVYFMGIYGVLLGTVAALLYRTNDIILYANKKLLHRNCWRTYAIYFVNLLVLIGSQYLYGALFDGVDINSYLRFVMVGAGTGVIALVIFPLAQLICFPHFRQTLAEILKGKTNI